MVFIFHSKHVVLSLQIHRSGTLAILNYFLLEIYGLCCSWQWNNGGFFIKLLTHIYNYMTTTEYLQAFIDFA